MMEYMDNQMQRFMEQENHTEAVVDPGVIRRWVDGGGGPEAPITEDMIIRFYKWFYVTYGRPAHAGDFNAQYLEFASAIDWYSKDLWRAVNEHMKFCQEE